MPKIQSRLLSLLLLLIFAATAAASEITLRNGDRITGKVVSRTDEKVVIETEMLGTVEVAATNIEAIKEKNTAVGKEAEPNEDTAPDKPAEKAEEKPDEKPVKKAEAAPEKKTEESSVPADEAKVPDAKKQIKPIPRLFGGQFFGIANGWVGNANIGFNYTSGNSRTTTLTTGISAVKTGHKDKLTAYIRSLWHNNRKNSRGTTQNAVWGGIRYDRDVNDRLFGFGSFDIERDAPKGLNFRTVVGGGIGHHTIKSDRTELDLMIGGAWNHAWEVGDNTDTPEMLGATVFRHRFNDRIKFQETFTFYQDITSISKYRFIFDTTLSADITKRIGWFITIGDRYNNVPVGNAEENDILFTTGMKWNFGKRKK